jgi:hypothetical protein
MYQQSIAPHSPYAPGFLNSPAHHSRCIMLQVTYKKNESQNTPAMYVCILLLYSQFIIIYQQSIAPRFNAFIHSFIWNIMYRLYSIAYSSPTITYIHILHTYYISPAHHPQRIPTSSSPRIPPSSSPELGEKQSTKTYKIGRAHSNM